MQYFSLKDEGYIIMEYWNWICPTHWKCHKRKCAEKSLEGGIVSR
jgi:hypothetical protein